MAKKVEIRSHPGDVLRAVRIEQGLSLRALAARISLPFSTLSKLENGKMALTYDKLVRLAQGLNVDIGRLVSGGPVDAPPPGIGRRSVARVGSMRPASEKHSHFYPASELLGKMMVPIIIDVKARSVDELGGLVRHGGEEYLYVLTGAMELHSDLYAPLPLATGDSIYFDSGMAHGYVRTGNEPCRVLAVCAGSGMQRFAQTADSAPSAEEDDAEASVPTHDVSGVET